MIKKLLLPLCCLIILLTGCGGKQTQSQQKDASSSSAVTHVAFNAEQFDKIEITDLDMALTHAAGWTPLRAQRAFGTPSQRTTGSVSGHDVLIETYQAGGSTLKITYAGTDGTANAFKKSVTQLKTDGTMTKDTVQTASKLKANQTSGEVLAIMGYSRDRTLDRTETGRSVQTWTYVLTNGQHLQLTLDNDILKGIEIKSTKE